MTDQRGWESSSTQCRQRSYGVTRLCASVCHRYESECRIHTSKPSPQRCRRKLGMPLAIRARSRSALLPPVLRTISCCLISDAVARPVRLLEDLSQR